MEKNENNNVLEPENTQPHAQQPENTQPETEQTESQMPEINEEITPQEPENTPEKKEKDPFNAAKFKRRSIATLLSVVFIAIVVVLNIIVSALADRFPSMDIDLTAQKTNTLSDQALEVAKGVTEDTTLYLIGTEDGYRKDQYYSNYSIRYSQVANLAERLAEANPKISVQFVDPDTNPQFVSEYADESLSSGMVLVRTDKRYKILTAADMFSLESDGLTSTYSTFTKVDSALAAALETVNLDTMPLMAIATGHGELLSTDNLSAFQSLMESENFQVQEVDILTGEIPEETQVLMIPTPTTDYTDEEIAKLRTFLEDDLANTSRTLLVTCHPTQPTMPKLAAFLEEWGVQVEAGVVAQSDTTQFTASNASYILVNASTEVLTDNTYDRLIAPSSAPITILFDSNNGVTVKPLWFTTAGAYVVTESTTQEETANPQTAQQTVATISNRTVGATDRSVIVFGSSYTFLDTFIGAGAFGDRAYISDLLQYTTGTDGSAVTVETQQVQTNTVDVTASQSTIVILGLGVFTVGLPLVILIVGLVIFLRRRHL